MADEFRINKDYAENYNKWRQKEELQKLKDRYGDAELEESSSSSEEEDEDAEALTPQLEKDWLRTLSAIKSKDPRIYNKDVHFYNKASSSGKSSSSDNESSPTTSQKKKEKPMFLKDYERKVILEKGGVLSDEDTGDEDSDQEKPPGYYEEQAELKKGLLKVLADVGSDSEEEFLTKRKKTRAQQEKEEQEYLEWLKGQKEELTTDKQAGIELDPLKTYWGKPDLDEGEKFLRDYILNKQYLEDDEDRIPTYDEIVNEDFSEEEEVLEKQETFERKYNFRFEEPDPEFLKSYPRTIGDSIRRKDDRRTKKRQEIKDRKLQEKAKRKEELKQLKNLKKAEILDKLDKIKQITGNTVVGFSEKDLEDDFDPDNHDSLMQNMFSEGYYEKDEDGTKPVFSDDEELDLQGENWDTWQGPADYTEDQDGEYYEGEDAPPHCEDPDFNMDADYDPDQPGTSWEWETKKKKKKRSKLARALEKKKPAYDSGDKTFEEYFDEYYKLDYEDVIGDLPCRFKYRQVQPNDFGLDTDEVLACRDKELNAWVSLRKMSQFRTEDEERFDKRIYGKKGSNLKKKLNVLTSLREDVQGDEEEDHHQPRGKRGKRTPNNSMSEQQQHSDGMVGAAAQHGKKRTHQESSTQDAEVEKPAKKKKKVDSDAGTQVCGVNKDTVPEASQQSGQVQGQKKRRRKKKKNLSNVESTGTVSAQPAQTGAQQSQGKQKKRKKRAGKSTVPAMSDERLKAYGINPKKFKYTHQKFQQPQKHANSH